MTSFDDRDVRQRGGKLGRRRERRRDDADLAPGPETAGEELGVDAARAHGHHRPHIVGPAQAEQQLVAERPVVGDELVDGEPA